MSAGDEMTTDTDRHYVEQCLDGHPEAFRALVDRYQRTLIAGIRVRHVRADLAEEAAQEAFLRAYANLDRLQKRESFFAWLFGIARHVVQEMSERERRDRDAMTALAREPAALGPTVGWSGDAALEAAVASLDEPFREAVLLRFFGGYSCAEMAALLDVPLGTVTKRLSRAYESLREHLQSPPPRAGGRQHGAHLATTRRSDSMGGVHGLL